MKRECAQPDPAESALAGKEKGFLKERLGHSLALAAAVGALVVPAALASPAEASPPMRYAGIVSNEIWTPNLQEAEDNAKLIADLGANAVRIFQPYTQLQAAEINNDKDRICNAAVAARDNHLTLFITMTGFYAKRGKKPAHVGYAPHTASGWRRFGDTMGTMMWTLAGPNGCAKDVPNLNIGELNEVNSPTFSSLTPEEYESMLEYTYPRLKAEAQKITDALRQDAIAKGQDPDRVQPVSVNILGGDLASAHNQLAFIKAVGKAKIAHHYVGQIFDELATHPYEENSSVSPNTQHPGGTIIGIADYGQLRPLVDKYFGTSVPIIYDEFGVESQPPANGGYTGRTPASVRQVSENTQADYYRMAFALTACQENVLGLFTFGLHDEADLTRWQAAPYYFNGTPKSSLPSIQETFNEARNGTISSC